MSEVDYSSPQFNGGDVVKCIDDKIPNSSIRVTKDKEYKVHMFEAKGNVPAWIYILDDNEKTRFINYKVFKPYFELVKNGS